MDKEVYKKKIKGLTQFRDKTEEELDKIVEEKEKNLDFEITTLFISGDEKLKAKELLTRYQEDFNISNVSEKNNLMKLVYYEILSVRIMKSINDIHKKNKVVPVQVIDTLNKITDKISQLKEELNIGKKDDTSSNFWETMKKKSKKWRENNQGSRLAICGKCGTTLLLKIRTDKYDCQVHPFFKDRILYNKKLVELYIEKKITKKELSEVFETSEDYINWLVKKLWKNNPHYKEKENSVNENKE